MVISGILEHMGVNARSFKGDFDKSEVPFLCFIENRLLLIYAYDEENIYFHDPGFGYGKMKRNSSLLKDVELIEVVTYEKENLLEDEQSEVISKYNVEKKKTKSRIYTKNLVFKEKKLLLKVVAISIVIFLIGLATPYISGKIVDEVIALKDLKSLYAYGFGLFLVKCFFHF